MMSAMKNLSYSQILVSFLAGFFVGPIYFNYVYPFLYHLIIPR